MPAKHRHHPHGRPRPRQRDHHQRALLRPPPQVAQGRRDGPVAVQGEDEQVEDGRRGRRVVHGEPQLAQGEAKVPVR